jgi:hypothetical protein
MVSVVVLVALLLGLSSPPAAYVSVGPAHVPLAISSWCWGSRCGAPISASTKTVSVRRGATVQVVFRSDPTQVHVAIGGARQTVLTHANEISWRATRSGGFSINFASTRGWVIYVGRLVVR